MQPYRLYLLQRTQDVYARLAPDEKVSVDELLDSCGVSAVIKMTTRRRNGRSGNLEVWEAS